MSTVIVDLCELHECRGDTSQDLFCCLFLTTREVSPLRPTRSEPTHFATSLHLAASQESFGFFSPSEATTLTAGGSVHTEMFFNSSKGTGGMGRSDIPSVYVVDSHGTRPALPPRPGREKKQSEAAQYLLFVLVILALFGLIIEACFIYQLHNSKNADSASVSKRIGGMSQQFLPPNNEGSLVILFGPKNNMSLYHTASPTPATEKLCDDGICPSKPVAHLTDGQDVHLDPHVMSWSTIAEPLLYGMTYEDPKLIIQKEGYYYIYSKVHFSDIGSFHHSVTVQTERYAGGVITLLKSRRYSSKNEKGSHNLSNSFLGGVFHLYKNDAICVNTSSTKHIIRNKAYENVFGAYMI
uniref:TNF superfamily member 14 n=1 Tax=Fundulus heteroclitus TaxID=8078 RepID=A0A3Q2PJZ7_FUNHE